MAVRISCCAWRVGGYKKSAVITTDVLTSGRRDRYAAARALIVAVGWPRVMAGRPVVDQRRSK